MEYGTSEHITMVKALVRTLTHACHFAVIKSSLLLIEEALALEFPLSMLS